VAVLVAHSMAQDQSLAPFGPDYYTGDLAAGPPNVASQLSYRARLMIHFRPPGIFKAGIMPASSIWYTVLSQSASRFAISDAWIVFFMPPPFGAHSSVSNFGLLPLL
jgi:hypothetical protein